MDTHISWVPPVLDQRMIDSDTNGLTEGTGDNADACRVQLYYTIYDVTPEE